jgi:hypothetical protein
VIAQDGAVHPGGLVQRDGELRARAAPVVHRVHDDPEVVRHPVRQVVPRVLQGEPATVHPDPGDVEPAAADLARPDPHDGDAVDDPVLHTQPQVAPQAVEEGPVDAVDLGVDGVGDLLGEARRVGDRDRGGAGDVRGRLGADRAGLDRVDLDHGPSLPVPLRTDGVRVRGGVAAAP